MKALIPVRSGSLRVKNKNLKPFAGSSLLELKVRQLLKIKNLGLLEDVVVNSNCDTMLNIAKNLGASTVKRDEYFASNEVVANELYENMAQNIETDDILIANVTNPMIKDETIAKCILEYESNLNKFDSLATVNSVKHFLWLDNKPINYNPDKKPRSQDLPNIISLNHAISILPLEIMLRKKDILGYNPNFYLVNDIEGVDIDNDIDFEFAEFLYNKLILNLGGG